jgi:hypothetical protein
MKRIAAGAVFVAAAVLVCGCPKKPKPEEGAANTMGDKLVGAFSGGQVKMDSSDGTTKITTSDGTTAITTSGKLPDNFPKDVPVYKGASVVNSVQGEDALGVTLQTTDSVQAIADFYKREMAKRGWQEEAAVNIQGNTMLSYVLGDRTCNVVINDAGNVRVITIGLTSTRDSRK